MSRYYSVVETAKFIRKALKESFPKSKFSVLSSSYAGGASLRIAWTDGATVSMVKRVVVGFEGSYFDSMIDYKGTKYANFNGEEVSFGADYIFTSRDSSDEAIERAMEAVKEKYPENWKRMGIYPTVEAYNNGSGKYRDVDFYGAGGGIYNSLNAVIGKEVEEYSFVEEAENSDMVNSIGEVWADGYGMNTSDKDGNVGMGYPSI